jgi:mono/diheme cytochrome c family protein
MKYDPDYHSSVIRNLRAKWKKMPEGAPPELTLTDEEIWDIYEDWHGVEIDPTAENAEDGDQEMADLFGGDAAIMIALAEAQEDKES